MSKETLLDVIQDLKNTSEKGVTFVVNNREEKKISYQEIYKKSLNVLSYLQHKGLKKNDELIFQLEDNEEFIYTFWACILGGIHPVPLTIGSKEEHKLKLSKVWKILSNPHLICSSKTLCVLENFYRERNMIQEFRSIKEKSFNIHDGLHETRLGEIQLVLNEDIAMIQFSSGSTGDPKGVILTHKNVITNIDALNERFLSTSSDVGLSWMPLTHDMGIICAYLANVRVGADLVLMPTSLFIRNPNLWFQKAHEHRATISYSPNFGYQYILSFYKPNIAKGWDLSNLRVIVNGAEPISIDLCHSFSQVMKKHGFKETAILPGYGLAEATVAVSLPFLGEKPEALFLDRDFLGIGQQIQEVNPMFDLNYLATVCVGYTINGCSVKIFNDDKQELPQEKIGYVHIRGKSVTKGYYNNSKATDKAKVKGWFNTFDLGFMKNERLFIIGRARDIIIQNGQNYHSHDIENVIEEKHQIKKGRVAVTSVYNSTENKEDVAVFLVSRKKDAEFLKLADEIKTTILEVFGIIVMNMIPVREIPKTTSGKPRRFELKNNFEARKFNQIKDPSLQTSFTQRKENKDHFPRDRVERRLWEIIENCTRKSPVSLYQNFINLGLESLTLLNLLYQIELEYGIEISLTELLESKHIKGLAERVKNKKVASTTKQQPVQQIKVESEPFPLTEIQMAYLFGRDPNFELGGISTHVYFEVETKLDIERLNLSLQKVIKRHPMLRAIFLDNGQQIILDKIDDYQIVVNDISTFDENSQEAFILNERARMSHHVFDPGNWPLFEIKSCKIKQEKYYLFISVDMLIADGYSIDLIGKELLYYYEHLDEKIPELEYSFKDYILFKQNKYETEAYKKAQQYWQSKLHHFPESPKLPMKNNPTSIDTPKFKRLSKTIEEKHYKKFQEIAKRKNVTTSSLLCAIFTDLLSFWSNQSSLSINVTFFNREPVHADITKIVGDFTSSIPLDIQYGSLTSIWEKAEHVQERLIKGIEHRDYDGVEFIRELSKINNRMTKAVLPIVFTSINNWNSWGELGEIKYSLSQTSQVYLDHQAVDMNGKLLLNWDYVEIIFEDELITTMFNQYVDLILEMISLEDCYCLLPFKDQMLYKKYNDTQKELEHQTLHQTFTRTALKNPKKIAIKSQDKSITYEELEFKSNQVARYLIEQGVVTNDLIGLSAERTIPTIINMLGILKAGGGYVPIDPAYPKERQKYILSKSNCEIILQADTYKSENITAYSGKPIKKCYSAYDIAYVLYTSGSTGDPKGVVIQHYAAFNTIVDIITKFNVNEEDRLIGISSLCFDLSVFDVFGTFSAGATLTLIPDQRDFGYILKVIEMDNVTIWNSVPALMTLLIEHLENDDLKSVFRLILLSGDWIPLNLPKLIEKHFPESQIISLGGATEASIWSIYFPIKELSPEWISIPYGYPLTNQSIYVLNEKFDICPVGVQGELYIGGIGLALSYFNEEEKTKAAFIHHSRLGRIYKTGDFGVMHRSGYVEFLGRKDHQIKIRGHRIELEEISNTLLKLEKINQAIAIDRIDNDGNKYICGYIVAEESLDVSIAKQYLGQHLPEYMIPRSIVKLDQLPITSNGKIDRNALPTPEMIEEKIVVQPANSLQLTLVEIFKKELNREDIGIVDNLFDLGINSISIIRIINEMTNQLKITVKFTEFIRKENIQELASFIESSFEGDINDKLKSIEYPLIESDVKNVYEPFELTEIQFAYLMGRDEKYEIGGVSTHFYGEFLTTLDLNRLETCIRKVIVRHPMLRSIVQSNGMQKILKEVPEYVVQIEDISQLSKEQQEEYMKEVREKLSHFVFSTNKWPLFDFKAYKINKSEHLFVVGYDLIIADAASMFLIGEEIMQYYKNPELELPELDFNFRDYVLANKDFKETTIYERDKKYWLEKLEYFPSAPQLPYRINPEMIKTPRFKRVISSIKRDKWELIKTEASKQNVTISTLLFTLYANVLAFWSNQPELAINLTVFNRIPFHEDINKVVGDFTTVLPLAVNLDTEESIWNKARAIQQNLFDSLEHRHYDGIEFIRALSKLREFGTKAVLPYVFTSMIFDDNEGEKSGWFELGEVKTAVSQTSQVYIDTQVIENNGELMISWDYVDQLFDDQMINEMFQQYIEFIHSAIDSNRDKLNPSKEDKLRINQYNNSSKPIQPNFLHLLFEEQVERTPDKVALIFQQESITYVELNEKANQVAHYLRDKGIKNNAHVGLIAERSIMTIINLLGILKSGAAYVPIDPKYPQKRIEYIIENSNCSLLLNTDLYDSKNLSKYSTDAPLLTINLDDVAYVIYTSGSTGKPKGVVITHRAVSNTIIDINQKFRISDEDTFIGISSLCFDLSVYDVFGALSTGATLVLISNEKDMNVMIEEMEKHKVTIWNSAPAIMELLIERIEKTGIASKYSWNTDTHYQIAASIEVVEEKGIPFNHTNLLKWSPIKHWEISSNDELMIDGKIYSGNFLKLFPDFYFVAQKGITKEELIEKFPQVAIYELDQFINKLKENQVLLESILSPEDLFSTQEKLFNNRYNEKIFFNEEEQNKYVMEQVYRDLSLPNSKKYELLSAKYPWFIENRASHRDFDKKIISYESISKLMSVLRKKEDTKRSFYYPSAGGLYPIDIYMYIVENRVKDIEEGIYYYNPIRNTLSLVSNKPITDKVQYYLNKNIAKSAAFSIYFIYNAEANMPKYAGKGYLYACIETGIMLSTLNSVAEMLGFGFCSIGEFMFDRIKNDFKLNENQVLIHSVLGGLKKESKFNIDNNRIEIVELGKMNSERNDSFSIKKEQIGQYQLKNHHIKQLDEVVSSNNREMINQRSNTYGTHLRLVMLSGDWIPKTLPKRIENHFFNTDIISLGGATEASIWSIYYPITKLNDEWKSIPYGYPLANQTIYILNYQKSLCPVSIQGEIYIGGVGLAKEYLNDPTKTKDSFITHPTLGLLYKTGDYGILHKDGHVEFLGRKDSQVKISGYRIDLNEISNCLLEHPLIENAIVIDIHNQHNKTNLCAYFISKNDSNVDESELKKFLSNRLPDYMVPKYFVEIESVPLSSNGKVERSKLPIPQEKINLVDKIIAPTNEVEEQLLNIWKDVLGIDAISVQSNFFDMGGDSIYLMRIHTQIEALYPGKVKITDLFSYPSISSLSEYILSKINRSTRKVLNPPLLFAEGFVLPKGEDLSYRYELEEDATRKLHSLAELESLSYLHIFTGILGYLMQENSENTTYDMLVGTELEDKLDVIELNFESIQDFISLFRMIKDKSMQNRTESGVDFSELKIAYLKKDERQIIPLVYEREQLKDSFNIKENTDIAIEYHVEKKRTILEFEYKQHLNESFVEVFTNDYIHLIHSLIEYYDSERKYNL